MEENEYLKLQVSIPSPLKQELAARAVKDKTTLSVVVQKALELYLEARDITDGPK